MCRIKRIISLILAVVTVFPLLIPLQGQAAEPEADFDGYLVRLKEAAVQDSLTLFSADSPDTVTDEFCLVEDLETAQAMERAGLAEYYEPNYRLELLDGEERYTPTQWNLLAVHAQAAWDHTDASGDYDARGDRVTVAVIDSGVYAQHPDFNGANILPSHSVTGAVEGVDTPHGTFVTGIIAAQVGNGIGTDGMVPNVTILPICVTSDGNSYTSRLVEALDYAVEQEVDVINLSIGGTSYTQSLEDACRKALDAGIILVAAAGNYRSGQAKSSSTYMYPASLDGVISVSACKQSGTDVLFDSSYSFFNDRITVAAPGTSVLSLDDEGGSTTNSGTSFAAPVVTAMAAMAKQRCPDLTPETFTELLCASAVDLGEPGYDIYYGHGLADVAAFLDALDQSYAITYELGVEDAAFPEGAQVPGSYTLGREALALPQPVRPGCRFLGWYETEDCSGEPVSAIPAGSVGDRTFYAAWECAEFWYFAQYDGDGRMLGATLLPNGAADLEDTAWLEGAVTGKLFRLDDTGTPLAEAQLVSLAPTS